MAWNGPGTAWSHRRRRPCLSMLEERFLSLLWPEMRYLLALILLTCLQNVAHSQVESSFPGHIGTDTDRFATSSDECAGGHSSHYQLLANDSSGETPDLSTDIFDSNAPVFRFKKRALQRVDFSGGWLRSTGNDINSGFLKTSLTAGIPIGGDLDNLVGVMPSFRVDFLDADPRFDVPDELFDTGIALLWRKKINDRLAFLGQVRPGIRSDFSTGDEAFRIFGLALWTWQWIPDELTLSFGAVALGRNDLPALPALGLTWTPDPRTKLEIGLPRSRFAYQIAKDGTRSETWSYLTGAIGGNTWAVTRQSGQTDELSLRDLRAMVGVEHVIDGGGGWYAEAGYAFARTLEYESDEIEIDLSDGFVVQSGWAW